MGENKHENMPLADALRAGGIFYDIDGATKEDALRSVVAGMSLPPEIDTEFLVQLLMAREVMGSTGIGGGIAIPHVRDPIVLHVPQPMVALALLKTPIDFGSVDHKPVHTLFVLVSPTMRSHLNLLSRLVYALRHSGFAESVARREEADVILAKAEEVDSQMGSAG